jgi:hypothetical protein
MATAWRLAWELTFFALGVFLLGTLVVDWLLRAETSALRFREEALAEPVAQVQREAIRTSMFAVTAGAAWRWADLSWLWLVAMLLLALSGLSGFHVARRLRNSPEFRAQRRSALAEAEVDQVVRRIQRAVLATAGVGLSLWVYSWRDSLSQLWSIVVERAAL